MFKSIRRMFNLHLERQRGRTRRLPLLVWLLLLAAAPLRALGYFLGDTKAVLRGCDDHWTLRDRAAMPPLASMTACADVRVVAPGAWVAFSYSSVHHAPRPELGLEGDEEAVYGWLLRVRHRFPVRLTPLRWHRVCLRRDAPGHSFSLQVDGKTVAERTVIAQPVPPSGSLWLGCRPGDRPAGARLGQVEVYMFRVWLDLADRGLCEDGAVIGWSENFWGVTSPQARQRDPGLPCAPTAGFGRLFFPPSLLSAPAPSGRLLPPPPDVGAQVVPVPVLPGGTSGDSRPPELLAANHGAGKNLPDIWKSSFTPSAAAASPATPIPLDLSTEGAPGWASADGSPHLTPPGYVSSASQTSPAAAPPVSRATPTTPGTTGSPLEGCYVSQLCSNEDAYFWMSISVDAGGDGASESDVRGLVSDAFGCRGDSDAAQAAAGFIDFCQDNRQPQVIEVTCQVKRSISQTRCSVLLRLRRAASACDLRRAAAWALRRAGSEGLRAGVAGGPERVARDRCEDAEPPSSRFVRCTPPSSSSSSSSSSWLDEVCQARAKPGRLSCSLIRPDSVPAPRASTGSCSGEARRLCDCAAFCNSATQFFAIRLSVRRAAVDVDRLQRLLAGLPCTTRSECQEYSEISERYQGVHLECHGTHQRQYSCMVVLEMLGPVDACSLGEMLRRRLIGRGRGIADETPLTRMVVCGSPGLPVHALLTSNLTWTVSDRLISDICQPQAAPLKCTNNETLAVLLADSCPLKPLAAAASPAPPSPETHGGITAATEAAPPPPGANVTQRANTAVDAAEPRDVTAAWRGATEAFGTNAATASLNPNPNTAASSPSRTAAFSGTSGGTSTPSPGDTVIGGFTPPQNGTVVHNATTGGAFMSSLNNAAPTAVDGFTPPPSGTAAPDAAATDTFTSPLNGTWVRSVSTVDADVPPDVTAVQNPTAADTFAPATVRGGAGEALTPSPDSAAARNVTAAGTFVPPPNDTAAYNVTTDDIGAFSPSQNNTATHNPTTVAAFAPLNRETWYNATAADTFTSSPNGTAVNDVTTDDINTFSPSQNNTAMHNLTTVAAFAPLNHKTLYNVSTADTFTSSPNDTAAYNVTTAGISTFPPSQNNTATHNPSRVAAFAPPDNETSHNITTADISAPVPEHATEFDVTTAGADGKLRNSTNASNMTVVSAFTSFPNYTTADNLTAAYVSRSFRRTLSNATFGASGSPLNYTTAFNAATAFTNFTAAEITATATATAPGNVTATPLVGSRPRAAVPRENATVAASVDGRRYNATASVKNSTSDKMTLAVGGAAQATTAPPVSQTAVHAAGSGPHSVTATDANDATASALNPASDLNSTAGPSLNLSSTAGTSTAGSTSTTDGPTGQSIIAAYFERMTTSSATSAAAEHAPLPALVNTPTTNVSLTSSATPQRQPGLGTSPTTASEATANQVAQEEQANELLDQTQDASQLNSSQVEQLVGQLENLLDGPTVSQTIGQKAINIISNLMEGDSLTLSASANRLIRMVDDLGLKLVLTGDGAMLTSSSLVLAVSTVDVTNFPTTSVNIMNTDTLQARTLSKSEDWSSGSIMASIHLPSSLTESMSPEEQQWANRIQCTYYAQSIFFQDAELNNKTLVSPVLGTSVGNTSISNLTESIQFTIRNTKPIFDKYEASCAYWDFARNGGVGGWSSAGCAVVNATPENTTCSCNHLTSFAILLDLSRGGITDRQQAQILTFITYIGCGVSAIFLAVTLLTYISFDKLLRDIPAKILVQLCLSLLLLNLVYLLDGWLALYPATGLCVSTAFFLHYFLLTSFTWAGLEALHMYLSIVQVFTSYLSKYMLKFTLMGWGVPLVVVVVVISVDKDNYGLVTYGRFRDGTSDDFCWLRNDVAFYVGVVAYFLLIFTLCLLVFIVVMVQLSRIKRQNPQNQSPNRGVMADLRSIAGLVVLLGLTWGFALFAWGPLYLPFVYLFSIFNCLQGFFIFLFHCAYKENVRRQWRTYLCCGRLRLAENSDWSRTVTQNRRNFSVATATSSLPQVTSRSSSVVSDSTNSSGSLFADSGISDGSNSDVVLNEIHRRVVLLHDEA